MKMDRLLAIVMLLLNRRRISARELSERFEVSLRTVYRDVETICQAGIPVMAHAGSSGGYEIMERYRLERQYLSMEELQSIVIALRGMRGPLDEGHISGLLDKVGAMLANPNGAMPTSSDEQVIIDLNPWREDRGEKERLADLRRAMGSNKLVTFTYTSNGGEVLRRTIEPMHVVLKGYVWYLYGYCRMREDYRIFRLSRIKSLDIMEETFERRTDRLPETKLTWDRGDTGGSAMLALRLRFEARARAQVEDYYESEKITEQPDGRLYVEAGMPDEPWLYTWLLGFGTSVCVLAPAHVAERLKRTAQEIVNMYIEY
jgi:predicted DNA-binding transcriptional regulator YafY